MKARTKTVRWLFFGMVLLLAFSVALSGCAKETTPVKDTLIIGVTDSAPGIDFDFNYGPEVVRIAPNTYPRGLEYRYEASGVPGAEDITRQVFREDALQPSMIESWEKTADFRTFTFHLKEGVKSFYGNEFTTEDVLWSFQRGFGLGAIDVFFYSMMDVSSIDNIQIIDDHTFSVIPNNPNPLVFSIIANHWKSWHDSTEAKKHATADDPWATEWMGKNGSGGLGPYVVDEWTAGNRIVLKANPNYVGGEPPIETVIFKVIPESASRMAALQDGTIDVAFDLSPTQLTSLEGTSGINVVSMPGNEGIWLHTNSNYPPFDNKLVRQALNWAVSRDEIAQTAFQGYATPWKSSLPMLYEASTSAEDFPYGYDLEKARQLLEQAGYSAGDLSLELAYPAGQEPWEVMATLVKASLAKIGVNVELKKVPWGAYSTQVSAGEMPFGIWSSPPMNVDPGYGIGLTYYGPSFVNSQKYQNPEVDALIEQGRGILNWEERIAFHKDIQKMVMDDAALVWVVEENYTVVLRDNIKGWNWSTANETLLEYVYFAE